GRNWSSHVLDEVAHQKGHQPSSDHHREGRRGEHHAQHPMPSSQEVDEWRGDEPVGDDRRHQYPNPVHRREQMSEPTIPATDREQEAGGEPDRAIELDGVATEEPSEEIAEDE